MRPVVSIIIPTFNSESTLRRCLQSVAVQEFRDFEVLIMDGLSTDRTLDIANQFLGLIPSMVIRSEKDRGIYDAMNKGITSSSGEWLYFLGSDDELYDPLVLKLIFGAGVLRNSVMLYGKALIVPDNNITRINISIDELMMFNICHQTIFYSKDIFRRFRFNTKYKILADWDLNLRVFATYHQNLISCVDLIICTFSNQGTSSNWKESDEYLRYFKSENQLLFRYRRIPQALVLAFKRLLRINS